MDINVTPTPFFTEETNPRRIQLNHIRNIQNIPLRIEFLRNFILAEQLYLSHLNPPTQRSAELDDAQRWLNNLERVLANDLQVNGFHVIGNDDEQALATNDDESLSGSPVPSMQLNFG